MDIYCWKKKFLVHLDPFTYAEMERKDRQYQRLHIHACRRISFHVSLKVVRLRESVLQGYIYGHKALTIFIEDYFCCRIKTKKVKNHKNHWIRIVFHHIRYVIYCSFYIRRLRVRLPSWAQSLFLTIYELDERPLVVF